VVDCGLGTELDVEGFFNCFHTTAFGADVDLFDVRGFVGVKVVLTTLEN